MQPKLGNEFTLNPLFWSGSMKLGANPTAAALKSGKIAVAWQDLSGSDGDVTFDTNVYVRLFKTDGTAVTEAIQVNTKDTGAQTVPEVTALADGGFLVGWSNVNSSKTPTTMSTFGLSTPMEARGRNRCWPATITRFRRLTRAQPTTTATMAMCWG